MKSNIFFMSLILDLIVVSALAQDLSSKGGSKEKLKSQSVDLESSSSYAPMVEDMRRLITRSGIPEKNLGLSVFTARSNQKVMDLNGSSLMVPASITKILTAAAALDVFPPSHQFETLLMSDAKVKNGVLDGALYLVGGGDPSFTSERLWYLVNEFVRNDIKEISGDLIVDDTIFDRDRFDVDRDPHRVDRAYDAPIGGMSFNWNSVNVFVRPGAQIGDPARVRIDPENEYIQLNTKAVTRKSGGKGDLGVSRREKEKTEVIDVEGHIGATSSEIVIYKSITRPDLWSAHNLVTFLRQRGIRLKGVVKVGAAPAGARRLARSPGAPLGQMIADMLKFSNNYVAEMLTKGLAAYRGARPATMAAGLEEIRLYLDRVGISRKDYVLQNSSGLSTENRFRPIDIVRVLKSVEREIKSYPEFLTGLPIAGVDGTLKSRFNVEFQKGSIRAKTGLLKASGVVSLAGYAQRKNGETLVFAFVHNSSKEEPPDRFWRLFDSLALQLIDD